MDNLIIMDARSPHSQSVELDVRNSDDPAATVVTITLTARELQPLMERALVRNLAGLLGDVLGEK